jgi:hypothetical protein
MSVVRRVKTPNHNIRSLDLLADPIDPDQIDGLDNPVVLRNCINPPRFRHETNLV